MPENVRRLPILSKASILSVEGVLAALLAFVLLLQLHMQFVQKINWDELFYLSHIYNAQEGRLQKVLQMFHVHLLGWITHVPGGEISQVQAGRLLMWTLQLFTVGFIIRIGCKFFSMSSALIAALGFVTMEYVFIHGTSFRADPLAACLMMYVVYVFAVTELKMRDLLGVAVALGVGGLVTIKVVLYGPLLFGLALWRLASSDHKQRLFLSFAVTAIGALVVYGAGFAWQMGQLEVVDGSASPDRLARTFDTVFNSGGLFPQLGYMRKAMAGYPVFIALVFIGVMCSAWKLINELEGRQKAALFLILGLPIVSFVFYRNAYPYFYAYILPPVSLLAGYTVEKITQSSLRSGAKKMLVSLMIVAMVAQVLGRYQNRIGDTQQAQIQTLNAVHYIFPEPVAYFDRSGFVASFPKAGFFMSTWGLRNYALDNKPVFSREMDKLVVPLVISNRAILTKTLEGEPSELLEEDARALRENYIPHWGAIWVAGKSLTAEARKKEFQIKVPGIYTVESDVELTINGQAYVAGQTINLARGTHSYQSEREAVVTLRWGDNLKRPDHAAPEGAVFTNF